MTEQERLERVQSVLSKHAPRFHGLPATAVPIPGTELELIYAGMALSIRGPAENMEEVLCMLPTVLNSLYLEARAQYRARRLWDQALDVLREWTPPAEEATEK